MQTLLTRRQVADLLSASTSTIIRLERAGQLPIVRLAGGRGRVRYAAADVQNLIEGSKEQPAKPDRVRVQKREG
ncbi:helix-turn-helix transcriptional regulator [Mesorhizobium sp. B1-1-8]|uniref:helix-turn-helix transcriptional regulator n=1 Tax=Mesorhizobium sp. B1-1-8 TaxID=2589976 RepID=UPI00112E6314|nr:helix-turn-helix domain-containing protein [Mesorhizobium sp. B1-1-8]